MDLVIVESPAKAKTINKYLGSGYQVLASYGHIRDLPSKDGSVDPDAEFAMNWQIDAKSKKRVSEIADAAKKADRLILATDPDREGEAISWHILQVLKSRRILKDKTVQRVVFNAITKSAILEAMENPRDIDDPLVDAYLARRALDYLVGFTLSPVLWRKLPGARSAGRVQSVALRLVCERENEIERFIPQEYWTVVAELHTAGGNPFSARLVGVDGKKYGRLDVSNEAEATRIKDILETADLTVTSVESKPTKRKPYAPFTTSTLQQEASRKLGFSSTRTMQTAQKLYEGVTLGGETVGLITYMRTDGVQIAPEGIESIRSMIAKDYGDTYLPEKPRLYSTKAKNAQEAHEAIRPTDMFRRPSEMRNTLDKDQAALYELIWKRTIASQMESARIERTTVEIASQSPKGSASLRATGQVIRFDGFLTLYQEGKDDEETEENKRLPAMKQGENPVREKIDISQHFTEPPPRYTEATIIKKMEELGIGRPSTYTSTLSVLQDRDYVVMDKKRLVPEARGRLVTAFLESFFDRYVEYDFTAELEGKLDLISAGELSWKLVLEEFWRDFSGTVDGIKDLRVTEVLNALNEMLATHVFSPHADGSDGRICPGCDDGSLSLKLGKFGAFIGCSNYPDCRFTRQLTETTEEALASASDTPPELGIFPETGEMITRRDGRFGPYLQVGVGAKPKRASIPKGWDPMTISLERAIDLLSLPRDVGPHPETGDMITAGIGRYGPFVHHQTVYANLENVEEVFTVGLNRAVSALAEKSNNSPRSRGAPAALKQLGDHPSAGGPITVRDGRYGPYVNHGKVNATLPKDVDPQAVTLEMAVAYIAEKAAKPKGSRKK